MRIVAAFLFSPLGPMHQDSAIEAIARFIQANGYYTIIQTTGKTVKSLHEYMIASNPISYGSQCYKPKTFCPLMFLGSLYCKHYEP